MKLNLTVLTLLFLIIGDVASAATSPRILLLTSIERPRLEKKLERIFIRKMKPLLKKGWHIETQHRADSYDLHLALTQPSIEGVIWVSHGSFRTIRASQAAGGAIAAKPMLLDYRGDDVAPVLTLKSSELKFLSVVGCNSKQILDYQEDVNTSSESLSELESYIPDHKVVAQWALRRASKRAAKFFTTSKTEIHPSSDLTESGKGSLQIKRSIPKNVSIRNLRPVRIYLGGKLLGILPRSQPGAVQTAQFSIPESVVSLPKGRLKIRIETGQHVETPSSEIVFGDFEFTSQSLDQSWSLFADSSGVPFGQNFRVYLPSSSIN